MDSTQEVNPEKTSRSVHAAACDYVLLRWHLGVDGRRVWLEAGEPWEAVSAPIEVGMRAREMFRTTGLTAPTIEGIGRMTFLTQPADDDRPRFRNVLGELGLDYFGPGRQIELPPTTLGPLSLRWLTPATTPTCRFYDVAATVLTEAASRDPEYWQAATAQAYAERGRGGCVGSGR